MTRQLSEATRFSDRSEFEEFTSYLGHEVRGPLTVILGNASLLQRLGSCDQRLRDGLEDIREQAEKLNRIIEGLFLLVGTPAECEPIVTRTVVSGVVDLFRKQHPNRPVQLTVTTEAMALGVQSYLEEILENLLSNADKYSPAGESIAVRVDGSCSGVSISVEDNGPGICGSDQQRIFGLFVRLDQTKAIAGHGIGLALSKRLAESMDGELSYEDSPAGGSRFVLTLPAPASPEQDRPLVRGEILPFRGRQSAIAESGRNHRRLRIQGRHVVTRRPELATTGVSLRL